MLQCNKSSTTWTSVLIELNPLITGKTCLLTQVLIPHPKKLTEGVISRRVPMITETGKDLELQHVFHVVIPTTGLRIAQIKSRNKPTFPREKKSPRVRNHHTEHQKISMQVEINMHVWQKSH